MQGHIQYLVELGDSIVGGFRICFIALGYLIGVRWHSRG